jgi:hypothetical protein
MSTYKGKVVHSTLEGGYWTIETDGGDVYKLEGGDKGLLQAGKHVEVQGTVEAGEMGITFGTEILKVQTYKIL